MAETATKPDIVDVTIERTSNDDGKSFYWSANEKEFLGEYGCRPSSIERNPFKPYRMLSNYLTITYRDCFLFDGSMSNKCIQAITGGQAAHDWRGPILVLKCRGFVSKFV